MRVIFEVGLIRESIRAKGSPPPNPQTPQPSTYWTKSVLTSGVMEGKIVKCSKSLGVQKGDSGQDTPSHECAIVYIVYICTDIH